MDPTNTGSFGAVAGGMSPELQAAIQRRAGGNPSGPMGQVTQSAPTANPQTQVPNSAPTPSSISGNQPMSLASVGAQPPQGVGTGLAIGTSEAELIIKALSSRLASFSKQEEARVGI